MTDAGADRVADPVVRGHFVSVLDGACAVMLFIMTLAAPWEIFQRTPLGGMTLVKLAGSALIGLTVLRMAVVRRWVIPRTGIELPLGVFIAICGLSIFHSLDRGLSWGELWVGLTYVALFYATASAVRDTGMAERLIVALLVSSVVVSGLALACAAGFLTPSLSYVTEHVSRRVLPGAVHEPPLRIVAASNDFNQGVFVPLMAYALGLFVFGWRRLGVARRAALYGASAVLLGAMLVAVSRSSVAIAVTLLAAHLLGFVRRRARLGPVVVILLILAAVGGVVGHRYVRAFVTRTESVSGHDPSAEGRFYGYSVAWRALPRYWLFGAGLNTSDMILAHAKHPEILRGQTLHSVPFKILLETGVVGLAAYFALIGAFVRRLWRGGLKHEEESRRRFGAAFLAWLFACFLVTCVQPLELVSMFPVLVGLALGPLARAPESMEKKARSGARGMRIEALVATLLVGGVVVPNAVAYQLSAPRVARFADYLEEGAGYEKGAEWPAAEKAYRAAEALAESGADYRPSVFARSIGRVPYYSNAAKVFELGYVYKAMALVWRPAQPRAATEFALARALFAEGRTAEAKSHLDRALRYAPDYAYAWFVKGECDWASGAYQEAVRAYAKASAAASAPGNGPYRERLNHINDRIRALARLTAGDPDAALESARLWRLQGNWNKAVALYREVAAKAPDAADAHFQLGVDAELEGDPARAKREYETALRLLPNHYASARRLRQLQRGRSSL